MPSTVSSKGEISIDPVSPGTHIGRCVTVVNLGLVDSGKFGPKPKHYIAFEIPRERVKWQDKDGNDKEGPAIIGSRYTSSLSPKAYLRQHLESWRGRVFTEEELAGFDLFKLLNVPAMLSVVHSTNGGNTYANIASISGVPDGVELPDRETPLLKYDPEDTDAKTDFEKLPEWMQKIIVSNPQQNEPIQNAPPTENYSNTDFDDDIPF